MPTSLDPKHRDALVHGHQELVKKLARGIRRDLPRHVSLDDLLSAGQAGLLDAATRFDPTRGAQFQTFAYYRIRGAIFDWIKRESASDPVARARFGARGAVDDLLASRAAEGAAAGDALDAARALAGLLEETATALLLEETAAATAAHALPSPEAAAIAQDEAEHVRDAMASLPDKERHIVDAVYLRGETIEDAGKELGLTKSWSSRLHARALGLLRERLGGDASPWR